MAQRSVLNINYHSQHNKANCTSVGQPCFKAPVHVSSCAAQSQHADTHLTAQDTLLAQHAGIDLTAQITPLHTFKLHLTCPNLAREGPGTESKSICQESMSTSNVQTADHTSAKSDHTPETNAHTHVTHS